MSHLATRGLLVEQTRGHEQENPTFALGFLSGPPGRTRSKSSRTPRLKAGSYIGFSMLTPPPIQCDDLSPDLRKGLPSVFRCATKTNDVFRPSLHVWMGPHNVPGGPADCSSGRRSA